MGLFDRLKLKPKEPDKSRRLSKAERDRVFQMLAEGYKQSEIAEEMGLTGNTVQKYAQRWRKSQGARPQTLKQAIDGMKLEALQEAKKDPRTRVQLQRLLLESLFPDNTDGDDGELSPDEDGEADLDSFDRTIAVLHKVRALDKELGQSGSPIVQILEALGPALVALTSKGQPQGQAQQVQDLPQFSPAPPTLALAPPQAPATTNPNGEELPTLPNWIPMERLPQLLTQTPEAAAQEVLRFAQEQYDQGNGEVFAGIDALTQLPSGIIKMVLRNYRSHPQHGGQIQELLGKGDWLDLFLASLKALFVAYAEQGEAVEEKAENPT